MSKSPSGNFPSKEQFYREMSDRLRVLREHLGRSPDEFSAIFGISTRNYLAYERGKRSRGWSCYKLYLLDGATNVSVNWLISGRAAPGETRNDNCPVFLSPVGWHTRRPALRLIEGGAA